MFAYGPTTGPMAYVPNEHDADLFKDAHNTYNSCQMLPSRMLERLKVAEALLLEMSDSAKDAGDVIQFGARALTVIGRVRDFLDK